MLSRKDLSKEFELVVKQEIKNYNDTVLSTNLSLNKCHQEIEDLSRIIEIRFSEQDNKLLEKEIKFDLHKDSIDKSIHQIIKLIGNLESKLISYESFFSDFRSNIEEKYTEKNEVYRLINDIGSALTDVNLKILQIKEDYSHQIKLLIIKFKYEFEEFKKEILDKPSELQVIKKELEKKIAGVSVDSEGVLKEIRICKKDSLIIDKKIENIYTLIERVNNRISECHKQA
jgi:hypothetical protein